MTARLSPATYALISLLAAWPGPAWLAGCAADDSEDSDNDAEPAGQAELLAAPPPDKGVQFTMNTELEAGVEAERCKFVQAPASGLLVNNDEVRFTSGSHHFVLYETRYTQIPTMNDDGVPVDTHDVFDCSDGASNGWSVTKLVGGSQNGQGESLLSFPEGVAVRVPPNMVLLMNAHYINATTETLHPEVRINLYTLAERDLREQGDLLFLYNPVIRASAGKLSRARMRCPVYEDITIANVQSHMHARGVGYAAMLEGQDPFYVNDQWENVPVKDFQDGLHVAAGERLDFYCDYENHTDHDIYQGPRTTDEMCMLLGSYYPANPALSQCDQEDGSGTAAEWVGEGHATCAETLDCLANLPETDGDLGPTTDCFQESMPDVSAVLSDAFRCTAGSRNPEADCAAELDACKAQ